jgi:ATP-dependent DNA ligase
MFRATAERLAVQRLDLEGIVTKRQRDPYTPDVVWRKIKNGA